MSGSQVGEPAPGFALRRSMDETVELGDLLARGMVLVVFYVFDFGRS
jgi:peroxiredoxin